MDAVLLDIKKYGQYTSQRYSKRYLTMYDTIQRLVRKELLGYEFNEWKTKFIHVIHDIKFGPPGIVRFEVNRFRNIFTANLKRYEREIIL
jgi:hypothetical protein